MANFRLFSRKAANRNSRNIHVKRFKDPSAINRTYNRLLKLNVKFSIHARMRRGTCCASVGHLHFPQRVIRVVVLSTSLSLMAPRTFPIPSHRFLFYRATRDDTKRRGTWMDDVKYEPDKFAMGVGYKPLINTGINDTVPAAADRYLIGARVVCCLGGTSYSFSSRFSLFFFFFSTSHVSSTMIEMIRPTHETLHGIL